MRKIYKYQLTEEKYNRLDDIDKVYYCRVTQYTMSAPDKWHDYDGIAPPNSRTRSVYRLKQIINPPLHGDI